MNTQTSVELQVPARAASDPATALRGGGALRVLHVFNRLGTGGTEYGILKLVHGLNHGQFEHRLCSIRGFDPELVRRRQLEDKLIIAGSAGDDRQFPLFRLARIMRGYRPHIVHSRNWGAIEAIPAARLARVPVVIHSEHGYELETIAGLPRRQRLLRRVAYAMANAVFAVTRDLRDYHARQARVSTSRIQVIYNGVDTQRFVPRPESRLRLCERTGWPAGSFVVGTVGRLVPIKDHSTLLKAAELLARQGVDVRVLLVGAGPELGRLEDYAAKSGALAGRVCFYGSSDAVPELLNAMDVFVLSSLSEGMSNTLLEAMASGLPVVATRVGGNPELIEEDRSGFLFRPGDIAALASRLECLTNHPELRRQLGAAARQRAVEHFGLERMIEDYRSLYRELAIRRGIPVRS